MTTTTTKTMNSETTILWTLIQANSDLLEGVQDDAREALEQSEPDEDGVCMDECRDYVENLAVMLAQRVTDEIVGGDSLANLVLAHYAKNAEWAILAEMVLATIGS